MEEKETHCNDEYNKFTRILDFRLPHKYKKIGLVGAISIFAFLIAYKFIGDSTLIVKDVLRSLVLLFMLVASLSKDFFEDEFNRHVRFQSYLIAFVCVTAYYISIPLIAVVFDIIITKLTGDGIVSFYKVSAFEILFTLMGLQMLFFETLKKFGRAQ